MSTAIRCGVLLGFVLLIACDNAQRPTAPSIVTAVPPAPVQPVAPAPPGFPPVSRLARVFVFSSASSYPVRDYTNASRFVLEQDSTFSLQYASLGGRYDGTFSEANGRIEFSFPGGGNATGTLNGELLDVRYSIWMEHSDFENAIYQRTQ
jgi:hypothetical protein